MSERDLWQEVLLRQIADARLDPAFWPVPEGAQNETAEARCYLTTPSKDLDTVCALAGVEMNALIDRMRKQLANVPLVQAVPVERKGARLIEHNGQRHTAATWAKISAIPAYVIRARLRVGWSVADALTIPARRSPMMAKR